MLRICVLMAALLAGCSGLSRRPASASASQIQVGKTRKSEVVEILGLPNRIGTVPQPDGSTVERWFYFVKPDSEVHEAEFRMGSATFRDQILRTDVEVILEYGPAGIVSGVQQGSPP